MNHQPVIQTTLEDVCVATIHMLDVYKDRFSEPDESQIPYLELVAYCYEHKLISSRLLQQAVVGRIESAGRRSFNETQRQDSVWPDHTISPAALAWHLKHGDL